MKKSRFSLMIMTLLLPAALFAQDAADQAPAAPTAPAPAASAEVKPGGADVAYWAGDYKKAAAICRAELKLNASNFNARFYLCRSLFKQGLWVSTINECKDALRIFPTSPGLHKIYGAALFYNGQQAEALDKLTYAIKRDSDSEFRLSVSWYLIGRIYYEKSQFHQSLSALSEAIRRNPGNMVWTEKAAAAAEEASLNDEAIRLYQLIASHKNSKQALKQKAQSKVEALKRAGQSSAADSTVVPGASSREGSGA